MPKFDPSKCQVKKVWCGKDSIPYGSAYSRPGTPHECLQQGIGAGIYTEKSKHLPFDSIQRIKYIGETHEESFRKEKIKNLTDLRKISKYSSAEISRLLKKILKKRDGKLDVRAYNSILLWLYEHDAQSLPSCVDE